MTSSGISLAGLEMRAARFATGFSSCTCAKLRLCVQTSVMAEGSMDATDVRPLVRYLRKNTRCRSMRRGQGRGRTHPKAIHTTGRRAAGGETYPDHEESSASGVVSSLKTCTVALSLEMEKKRESSCVFQRKEGRNERGNIQGGNDAAMARPYRY